MADGPARDEFLEAIWAWDPIGVRAARAQAATEYDDLAEVLLVRAEQGCSLSDLEAETRAYVDELGITGAGIGEFLRRLEAKLVGANAGDAPSAS